MKKLKIKKILKKHSGNKMKRDLAPIFRGNIENGKLILRDKELFSKYLCSLRGEVEVICRKWRKRRTNRQNSYYWSCVIPLLCEYTGYSDEELHEALKIKFLSKRERDDLPTVRSTATLSTKEFANYIEKIVLWAGQELGVMIPPPEQVEI